MNEEKMECLKDEYSKLFSLFEKHWILPYNVSALVIAFGGAFTLYGGTNRAPWGVFVCYGFVLLLLWLAYIHTFVNGIGLSLVELECKINAEKGLGSQEGLAWCSTVIGDGHRQFFGLSWINGIVVLLAIIIFLVAMSLGWSDLQQSGWNVGWRLLATAPPPILSGLLVATMCKVENKTRTQKELLLHKYGLTRLRSS